jgi:hypothetical protein
LSQHSLLSQLLAFVHGADADDASGSEPQQQNKPPSLSVCCVNGKKISSSPSRRSPEKHTAGGRRFIYNQMQHTYAPNYLQSRFIVTPAPCAAYANFHRRNLRAFALLNNQNITLPPRQLFLFLSCMPLPIT